jgi:hypothetical protein
MRIAQGVLVGQLIIIPAHLNFHLVVNPELVLASFDVMFDGLNLDEWTSSRVWEIPLAFRIVGLSGII